MSKTEVVSGIIYSSGVNKRTEMILRAFAAENELTLSHLMDILAHVVSGYGTLKMFDGTVGEFDPEFGKLDTILRNYLQTQTPEKYYRIPLLQRLFGRLYKPLSKQKLAEIDRLIEEEEAKKREEAEREAKLREVGDVKSEDIE